MIMEKRWKRTRSIEMYPHDVKTRAREAYMRWAHMDTAFPSGNRLIDLIRNGYHDDLQAVAAIAFVISEQDKARKPAGVKCTGCGSAWDDERLAEEKAKRPELRSCCPERKMAPVFWYDDDK